MRIDVENIIIPTIQHLALQHLGSTRELEDVIDQLEPRLRRSIEAELGRQLPDHWRLAVVTTPSSQRYLLRRGTGCKVENGPKGEDWAPRSRSPSRDNHSSPNPDTFDRSFQPDHALINAQINRDTGSSGDDPNHASVDSRDEVSCTSSSSRYRYFARMDIDSPGKTNEQLSDRNDDESMVWEDVPDCEAEKVSNHEDDHSSIHPNSARDNVLSNTILHFSHKSLTPEVISQDESRTVPSSMPEINVVTSSSKEILPTGSASTVSSPSSSQQEAAVDSLVTHASATRKRRHGAGDGDGVDSEVSQTWTSKRPRNIPQHYHR